jgi:hypothetical protein
MTEQELHEVAKLELTLETFLSMLMSYRSPDGTYPENFKEVIKEFVEEELIELANIAGYTLIPITERAWPLRRVIRS